MLWVASIPYGLLESLGSPHEFLGSSWHVLGPDKARGLCICHMPTRSGSVMRTEEGQYEVGYTEQGVYPLHGPTSLTP